jgi:hypothetical protein
MASVAMRLDQVVIFVSNGDSEKGAKEERFDYAGTVDWPMKGRMPS